MNRAGRRRDRHRTWLTLFALANLGCWAAVAAAIGLIASDSVDLGVEALIRRGQATAVAVWKQTSSKALQPTAIAQAPLPSQAETPGNRPAAGNPWPAPSTPTAHPEATPAAEGNSALTSGPPDSNASPQPVATLVSSPLLLADPEINSLALLDAELARSALERPVQIRYGEEALNREIAGLSQNYPDHPFRNVQVDLQPNRAVITAKVTVLGFQVNAQVTGRAVAQDCLPHLQIETVSVAGVMTPRFVRDQVEQIMLDAITWYPADYPLCLDQIVLEETRATVYGHLR